MLQTKEMDLMFVFLRYSAEITVTNKNIMHGFSITFLDIFLIRMLINRKVLPTIEEHLSFVSWFEWKEFNLKKRINITIKLFYRYGHSTFVFGKIYYCKEREVVFIIRRNNIALASTAYLKLIRVVYLLFWFTILDIWAFRS